MSRNEFMAVSGAAFGCCIAEIIRVAMGSRLSETSTIIWISMAATWIVVAISVRIRAGR